MIYPALRSAKEKQRRVGCLNNLKHLGLAIGMYADKNGGVLPLDSPTPTIVGSLRFLSNATASASFLYCPGDSRPGSRAETDFGKLAVNNISYSLVPCLAWHDIPDSILALDRIYVTAAGSTWPTNGNHMGEGGNVLFNDGHVEWKITLPSALKDMNGREIVLSP